MLKFQCHPGRFTYNKETNELTIEVRPDSKFSILPCGIFNGLNLLSPLNVKARQLWHFIIDTKCPK